MNNNLKGVIFGMPAEAENRIDHIEVIEEQIAATLNELKQLNEKKVILKTPADLEKAEKEIIELTDKLASLMTAKTIQRSLDSDEMKAQSKELVSSLPQKMKNEGKREVNIKTSRGKQVTIKASYYSQKKKTRRRKKKR